MGHQLLVQDMQSSIRVIRPKIKRRIAKSGELWPAGFCEKQRENTFRRVFVE
jgi:hypothetical protein